MNGHNERSCCFGLSLLLVWSLIGVAPVRAEECPADCPELECHLARQTCLIEQDDAPQAIQEAKALTAQRPHPVSLDLLLARGYLAGGNTFWAERVLSSVIESHPRECDARAWLAWIRLGQGEPSLAAETLVAENCPSLGPQQGRWALIRLAVGRAQGDLAAQRLALEQASLLKRLYPEDGSLLRHYRSLLKPDWQNPMRLEAGIALGYTSNVSAGLPTVEEQGKTGSPLMLIDLYGRTFWPIWKTFWPSVELNLNGQFVDDYRYDDALDVHQANHLSLGLRPGLMWRTGDLRGFVGYRGDLFILNSPDRYGKAPLLFYEGHRADLELEPGAGFTLFAGFGKKFFRRSGRTRWELDGGVGWGYSPWSFFTVLVALSGRYYPANDPIFDRSGASALLVARFNLPARVKIRLGLTSGLEHYPNAARIDDSSQKGGQDWLLKPSLEVWSPPWSGIRVGAVYSYNLRRSETEVSFGYTDHRALLKAKASFDLNPWAASESAGPEHVPLPYGLGGENAGALDEERIQDLLRQDEAARRGSSCIN